MTVKFSLISATSIIALITAAGGPGHAAEMTPISNNQSNLYDLVHDGMTSADGGDRTVTKEDPLISAVSALKAVVVGWQTPSFTGPVDLAATTAIPRAPLAAAPGTKPDDDFATPISGAWQWTAVQKAGAIGYVRIASLIGTVGTGSSAFDKASGTVFVAEGSRPGFSDSGMATTARGPRPSPWRSRRAAPAPRQSPSPARGISANAEAGTPSPPPASRPRRRRANQHHLLSC